MHVDIVVFSASDLKRRTPSSHNLFDFSTQFFFQLCRAGSSWVDPELSKDKMGLAQGHNAVTRVMFEPATPCTLTLRCIPKISSEQNKIGPPK